MRVSWDEYFLELATTVATRATCPVKSVGTAIINPSTRTILAVGYNGAPRGLPHCGEACENRNFGSDSIVCRAVHAEQNAIYNAALNGVKLQGSWVYNTCSPCKSCAQALIQIGAERVTFRELYHKPEGMELLYKAGIATFHMAVQNVG